jgi:hypothetical protein
VGGVGVITGYYKVVKRGILHVFVDMQGWQYNGDHCTYMYNVNIHVAFLHHSFIVCLYGGGWKREPDNSYNVFGKRSTTFHK